MQIFKRLKPPQKKQGQNLIEFAFVLPTLIFLTLVIFEVALFWQDLNAIYALNTEINANVALVDPKGMALGSRCIAADAGLNVLKAKDSMISMSDPTYTTYVVTGKEPFALYRVASNSTVAGSPQISLWVDCRNPFENGITTQVEFYHKTLIIKASIPRFDDPSPIVIIPDNVFISTPKLNTIRHY
jgi:hypothetical protein